MRILLTQRELKSFAGTEMITLDLARSLKKRGHEVAVYCPKPGKVCGLLAANGVSTHASLNDVPWRPDVIHCHHQLPAMAALTAFEGTPAVYACHGVRPWVEHPPLHPQLQAYVAVSSKMAAYIAATYAVPEQRIRIIPNFVDTDRFSVVRKPPADRPRKAVLFGQNFKPEEVALLEEACAQNAIALDKIGGAYRNPRPNPELFLPDYDIAFAIGRSAVEAMACGCATIPVVPHLAGQIVTTGNFGDWVEKNFSPRYFTTGDRVSVAWLKDQLASYDPRDIEQVTETVRREFTLRQAVDQFESLYREFADRPPLESPREALIAHLEKMAREADDNWLALQKANAAEARLAASIKDQTVAIREAQRQVRFLMDCVLSKAGRDLVDADNSEWIRSIEANGLFDKEWYLKSNPDVAESGMDPLMHYLTHGAFENRKPSPSFDGSAFLSADHPYGMDISPLELMVRQFLALSPNIRPRKRGVKGWLDKHRRRVGLAPDRQT